MITRQSQRILLGDGVAQPADLTLELNDFRGQTADVSLTTTEYLYIGSELPFAFRYFDLSTPSTATVNFTIQYWSGSEWQNAVDILDETNGWQTPGYISWKTDRDFQTWSCEDESSDIPDLVGTNIYELYWLRISVDADLDAGTLMNTINFKFSNDDELYGRYPDLNNSAIKMNYEAGKTDWDEQHFIAGEVIVRDITRKNLTWSGNSIIDFEKFAEAGQHKVAEIVYGAMGGEGYEDNRKRAREYYQIAMNQGYNRLDLNRNANLDKCEKQIRSTNLQR